MDFDRSLAFIIEAFHTVKDCLDRCRDNREKETRDDINLHQRNAEAQLITILEESPLRITKERDRGQESLGENALHGDGTVPNCIRHYC